MKSSRWFVLSLIVLGIVGAPATGQEEATAKTPDPAVAEQLKQFKDAIKDRKGERDPEATNLIDKLLLGYPSMHPKDQEDVLDAVEDCLLSSRYKREPEHKGLFVAAAYALGQMGPEGAKVLVKACKSSKFKKREWVAMRAVLVKNVGKAADPRQVDFLLDTAGRDPEDEIMKAAGEALGHYDKADQKIRKEIVKELIKKFSEVYGKARESLDPGNAQVKRSKDRLAAISQSWNTTLSRLTGESINSPPDWQRFWNKNKARDWDK